MLRPVETPTREIKKLDGLWAFSLDRENCGIDQRWWESALQESRAIAVPGSFNDQFADADIRNLISVGGKARYKKAGQLLCRAVLTISSPMQIFVIMWATSGISAKSLYRKVGQASVSCCVSMRSLITAKCG